MDGGKCRIGEQVDCSGRSSVSKGCGEVEGSDINAFKGGRDRERDMGWEPSESVSDAFVACCSDVDPEAAIMLHGRTDVPSR